MLKRLPLKVVLVVVLVAAWLIGTSRAPGRDPFWNWTGWGILVFGILNAVFTSEKSIKVSWASVGIAVVSLIEPELRWTAVLFGVLVWPLAIAVSYYSGGAPQGEPQPLDGGSRQARIVVASMIAAVAMGSIAYRLLYAHGLQQTAALFLGIPALLAIVVVFGVSPQSAVGVATKAVTVALLVSLLFLNEGMLCIILSAPLFYAIAIVIAGAFDIVRRDRTRLTSVLCSVVIIGVFPMSLEGVLPATTVDRHESVTVSRLVPASADSVAQALFEPPRFNRGLPAFLRTGFPTPLGTRIESQRGTTRWSIQFRGGEFRIDGMEPRVGDLVLELTAARPGELRWRAVSDTSHMTHFLDWDEMVVTWEPLAPEMTRVTWTLAYRRGLDPAWYFGPMERYAVRLAAGYLIETVATP